MPAVHFATNWHIFFGYCVRLGDHTVPLAFRTIFNNACCVCAMWWQRPCRGRFDDNPAPRRCSCWLGAHHHPASSAIGRMKILSFCWCCFMFPNPILYAACEMYHRTLCGTLGPAEMCSQCFSDLSSTSLLLTPPSKCEGDIFFTVGKTWSLEV